MEGGQAPADRCRPGGFVAGDIVALPADVGIDRATLAGVQHADDVDVLVDLEAWHCNNNINLF